MYIGQLNELDLDSLGDWPWIVKALSVLLLCAVLAAGWYFLDTSDQLMRLAGVEDREAGLRAAFESKQQKAANLDILRQQLEAIEGSFGSMLRQLPDKTEVAALLVDVSRIGLAAGLTFELFQPMEETLGEFYAELPIQIRVLGSYHDFGSFVSGLGALPHILIIRDIGIATRSAAPGLDHQGPLTLTATLKTYRYLEEAAGR